MLPSRRKTVIARSNRYGSGNTDPSRFPAAHQSTTTPPATYNTTGNEGSADELNAGQCLHDDPNHFGKYVAIECYPGATKILAVIAPQKTLDLDARACEVSAAVKSNPDYGKAPMATMYSNDYKFIYCTMILPIPNVGP